MAGHAQPQQLPDGFDFPLGGKDFAGELEPVTQGDVPEDGVAQARRSEVVAV